MFNFLCTYADYFRNKCPSSAAATAGVKDTAEVTPLHVQCSCARLTEDFHMPGTLQSVPQRRSLRLPAASSALSCQRRTGTPPGGRGRLATTRDSLAATRAPQLVPSRRPSDHAADWLRGGPRPRRCVR